MSESIAESIELPNGATLSADDKRKLSWSGEHSGEWLERLPDMTLDWCRRWDVSLEARIPEINYNLVLFGTSSVHGPVAIKASPPNPEATAEIEAVRVAQGPGIVRLYDSDPAESVMLQERVLPGTMLRQHVEAGEFNDIQATTIAATCMRRFWLPDPHSEHLITLHRWFEALYAHRDQYPDGGGGIGKDIIDLAIHLADHLLATEQDRYTVHGDLNPGNILRNQHDGWTIIDPKGLVAERGYEIGQWMLNPYGLHKWPNLTQILDTRLSILSNLLELDRSRLWQWAVAHAALSECWTVADRAVDSEGLHAVKIIRALCSLPEGRNTIDPHGPSRTAF